MLEPESSHRRRIRVDYAVPSALLRGIQDLVRRPNQSRGILAARRQRAGADAHGHRAVGESSAGHSLADPFRHNAGAFKVRRWQDYSELLAAITSEVIARSSAMKCPRYRFEHRIASSGLRSRFVHALLQTNDDPSTQTGWRCWGQTPQQIGRDHRRDAGPRRVRTRFSVIFFSAWALSSAPRSY
jgi:hypothetical protein